MNWTEFRTTRHLRTRPLIVAHRGAPTIQPENTLSSFALALAQGADVLETDLRFTADDQIVLFHDPSLDRKTDGQGPLNQYTLAELKKRNARAPGGQLTSDRIPTLAELIEATAAQVPLLLELKDARFTQPQDARRLVDLLNRYDMLQRVAIVSFHAAYVAGVERVAPQIPTGLITAWNPLPLGKAQLLGPIWPLLYLNPWYVAWARRRNKIVCPLDTKPEPRIGRYLKLGVDALLTDHAGVTIAAIAAAQAQAHS